MTWQEASQHGSEAEELATPLPGMPRRFTRNGEDFLIPPNTGKAPREPNRIFEMFGLMGAIGEQLGVACTFERDVQRFVATAEGRMPEYQRMIQRALAEPAGYYTLGASHSLGNLVLRLLLLNEEAAGVLTKEYDRASDFPPLSDEKESWVSLNHGLSRALGRAGRASSNDSMTAAVEAVRGLERSTGFRDLEARRGMDYHRRRPQSVEHASPRRPVVVHEERQTVMTSFGAQLEPEADADLVHGVVVAAMEELATAMTGVRGAIPNAVRGEGITFVSA